MKVKNKKALMEMFVMVKKSRGMMEVLRLPKPSWQRLATFTMAVGRRMQRLPKPLRQRLATCAIVGI